MKTLCKTCGQETDNVAFCDECIMDAKQCIEHLVISEADWYGVHEKKALELLNVAMLEYTRSRK